VWKIKLKLNAEELRRSDLPEKYTAKICLGRIMEILRMNIYWKGIGQDGSQFLWRRNLKERVMLEL